jgi:hypothetical protein
MHDKSPYLANKKLPIFMVSCLSTCVGVQKAIVNKIQLNDYLITIINNIIHTTLNNLPNKHLRTDKPLSNNIFCDIFFS